MSEIPLSGAMIRGIVYLTRGRTERDRRADYRPGRRTIDALLRREVIEDGRPTATGYALTQLGVEHMTALKMSPYKWIADLADCALHQHAAQREMFRVLNQGQPS